MDKKEEIAKIVHCAALSQVLIEDIEDSIHDNNFKHEIKKRGKSFIKALDTKLDTMLDEEEAQIQLLNYVTVLKEKYYEIDREFKKEIKEIFSQKRA